MRSAMFKLKQIQARTPKSVEECSKVLLSLQKTIWTEKMQFLIKVIEENGYKKEEFEKKLVSEVNDKHGPAPTRKNEETEELGSTISLP